MPIALRKNTFFRHLFCGADKLPYRHQDVSPTSHQLQCERILAGAASLRSFKIYHPEFFLSDDVKPFEGTSHD